MYPSDLEAHLESYGGWFDLSGEESDEPGLTPATTDISKSILRGGAVKVQHAESGERFWIEVVNYDPESGRIWGLVANKLLNTDLDVWHPVLLHVFSVWQVLLPDEGRRLSESDEEVIALVPSDHLPHTPPPEDHQYEGEIYDGEMHGFGTLTEPDGRVYVGEFRHGLRHGHGKQTYTDGGIHVGYFNAGVPHGPGTITDADGTKTNNVYREGIILSSDGELEFGTDGLNEFHFGMDALEDHPEFAFKWFSRSAELGHEGAEVQLAWAYMTGQGVETDTVQAVERLRPLAARENPEAQLLLGLSYQRTPDVDVEESVKLIRAAAEQGYPPAKFELGLIYKYGYGVEQDWEKSIYWVSQAAEEGFPRAQYVLGQCLTHGEGIERNEAEAVTWFRKAAESEDEDAQYELGRCLRAGLGVDKDPLEAFEWMLRSAVAGNEEAQSDLTEMYSDGEGTELDLGEAAKWHRRLAESGSPWHQSMLADCYFQGDGVEVDVEEAAKWYRAAAEQEMPYAFVDLGICYEYGLGLEEDEEKAFQNYQKGYELGDDPRAVLALANCYRNGCGVDPNIEEAKKYYLESAESGNSHAKLSLGFLYSNDDGKYPGQTDIHGTGLGVETDMPEAIKWYRAAAEDGEPVAQVALGDLYWEGESVDQDDEEAIKWYRASADSESYGFGRVALGRCYDLGLGVETDKEKAFQLYMEALEIDEDLEYEVADPLAVMYAQGKGVNQDFDEARKWFYRAQDEDTELWNCLQMMFDSAEHQDVMDWVQAGVDRGDPEFVHALGACYWTGTSVEEDNYLALKLTFEAVKSGYEPAKVDLFEIIFFLHGEENFTLNEPEEFDELEKYLRSLAEGGDPEAAYALGNFYWANWHGKENPELAFKWFKTVGEQPDARPKWKYQLGYCYQEGYGVKENPEDAFKWFLQSAEDGFYLANEVVSECYREGIGVDKNLEEAEKWTLKQTH